jgi:adenosylmethionine-8-amino-7-oxononanoate aminotransferase
MQMAEFVQDPATKRPFPPGTNIGLRIGKRALHNGLLLRYDPHWIAFGPPLIVTAAEIDQMVAILEQSLREVVREM